MTTATRPERRAEGMGCASCQQKRAAKAREAAEQAVADAVPQKSYVRSARLRICEACPKSFKTLGRLRCRECGCFMEVKSYMRNAKCPLRKW